MLRPSGRRASLMTESASQQIKNITRALRLPFITASILPFIAGSLLVKNSFSILRFFLGCLAVVFTHLSANLLNDYADSKSKADWQDKRFYGFFGGSKLIQEHIFSEKFYLNLAFVFSVLAMVSILALAILLKNILIVAIFLFIIFLAWSYSHNPLQFSYRRLGEIIIFLLFGPALVMGGYFIQTSIFPTKAGFFLSLPFGFLTTAILYINEIPDLPSDMQVGKLTWVSLLGAKKAFIGYAVLVYCAFLSIISCIAFGYLSHFSLVSVIFIALAIKAMGIAKKFPDDKMKLIESSKLTIAMQVLVSIILILDLFL
jgi:1,4-dihydroxy-2-naphthoate octaprenyltransferase